VDIVLEIVPLRSLLAVATFGGFHSAARALHLTQAAVSRHVQRLEDALGTELVQRDGRGFRFTAAGEQLLLDAERILAAHDDAVANVGGAATTALTFGTMDHAADEVLPDLAQALREALPGRELRFRIARSATLRQAIGRGVLDVAIVFDGLTRDPGRGVDLHWLAGSTWRQVGGRALPLVLFDDQCSLRRAALDTLKSERLRYNVIAESPDLTGIHAAVRSGLGVTLLPLFGRPPDLLVEVPGLPNPPSAILTVQTRTGLPPGDAAIINNTIAGRLGDLSRRDQ